MPPRELPWGVKMPSGLALCLPFRSSALMARPLRIEFPGAIYHVTSRGNARQAIFLDDDDRRSFLLVLDRVVSRFRIVVHAFCLMDNHFHLLIETPEANLSKTIRQLNG